MFFYFVIVVVVRKNKRGQVRTKGENEEYDNEES